MKRKLAVILTAVVVAMGLLLGTSAAQETEVILDDNGNVIQILNLSVFIFQTDTYELYNVEFKYGTAVDVFGDGETVETLDFDFPRSNDTVFSARYAVDNALNLNDTVPQGAGEQGTDDFFIPTSFDNGAAVIAAGGENLAGVWSPCEGQCIDFNPDVGNPGQDPNLRAGIAVLSPVDNYTWADFTLVSAVPDPGTIGGTVTGLVGSGLVLQNNGIDDLPIAADGPFTFVTPLTPGDSYDVTVFTQPEGQICIVENGSGVMPDEGSVTNVAVSCDDAPPPEPVVLRDCPGGAIVGGVYRGIVLTDYEDCVITDVVVVGSRGVVVRNPRLFSIINSYVKGPVTVRRDNKSLEPSTATIINNLIDGGSIEIKELDEADVRRNAVYEGSIRVIDSKSQPDQYAEIFGNRIKGGNLRVNYNLSADVRSNSTEGGNITCVQNLVLDSSGNEAVNGRVACD